MIRPTLLTPIEASLNALIARDPETLSRLQRQTGLVFELRLQHPSLQLFLTPTDEGLLLRSRFDGLVDSHIDTTGFALLRAAQSGGSLDSLFDGDIVIEGDQEAGERFLRTLAHLDIDWADWLAQHIGPAAAGIIEQHAQKRTRQFREWRESRQIEQADYLVHDSRLLADALDVADFLDEVDGIRDRVDQLMRRIDKLATQADKPKGGPA